MSTYIKAGRNATIKFREDRHLSPIRIDLVGPESEVEKLHDSAKGVLAGMRPWYWWITRFNLIVACAAVAFLGLMAMIVVVYILDLTGILKMDDLSPVAVRQVGLGFTIMLWFFVPLVCLVEWFKRRLFPKATFAVGQGLARHRLQEKLRWGIVIAFLVSMFAGLPIALLL